MTTESKSIGKRTALDEEGKPYPGAIGTPTDDRAWHPTENQMKALEYVLSKNCDFTVEGMARHIGMRPKNWYCWRENRNFLAWWHEQLEQHMHDQLPAIMAGLLKIAKGKKSGTRMQVAAIKLIMERFDKQYAPRSKSEINMKGELKLGVGNAKLEEIFDQIAARFPKQPALAQDPAPEHAGEEEDSSGDPGRAIVLD